ncbi:MAG TPA: aminopeptidase [Gemmatimonadaceae bacterium]|nr:aminopeptidase [Gemmatimonadaceae bacterium]
MPRVTIRLVLKWLLVSLGIALAVVIATPLGRYIMRAGWEEAKILSRRVPIEKVVADPATPADLRARLQLVLAARQYAVDTLGLEAGESFTTFARLDRDTLVLLLSAAYRDRLEAYRWWFPIVGRLPYKGYFKPEAALAARDDFRARGFDTYVRPASAFSTLGWFNDPLLSTTVRGDTTWLVNTVIHELSHNTLFVAGNAEFSESFASFIGARGAEAFFRSRNAPLAAEAVIDDWANDQVLGRFWEHTAKALDSAYAAWPNDSAARVVVRDSVYQRARRELVDSIGPLLRGVNVQALGRIQLDNASLLARRVYAQRLDLFDSVWVRNDRDVRRSIGAVRDAVRGVPDPFAALERLFRR